MRFAVVVFPGTSGEQEVYNVLQAMGEQAEFVNHHTQSLEKYDAIILPGGFSYGDYLRSGAIAKQTPIIDQINEAANRGKLILGLGNGFQILLESNLLPGAMLPNEGKKFKCFFTKLVVENNETAFTSDYQAQQQINLPIAHETGNYYCDAETLKMLEAKRQIVFRYQNNPNGSTNDIAGIINSQGNVLGMMPRPERATEDLLGSKDGSMLFTSIVKGWRDSNGTV